MISKYSIFFILLSFASACKTDLIKGCTDKNSLSFSALANENDSSCIYGGIGGNVSLKAFPKHHNLETFPTKVYLAFNTSDAPINLNQYSLEINADSTKNFVEIKNLKPGFYYIYIMAFDKADQENVLGGLPIKITQTNGEMTINVPVVE